MLATSYLAEVFEPYFGDGSSLGLHLEYVTEEEPLGTGGAIRNVASRLRSGPDDPVLIFNGDILTGLDIGALVATHRSSGADVSLHLTRVEDPRAFGLVPTDATGRVTAFLEKPQTPEEIVTDQINAGAYVFRRSVIDTIPAGRPVSVERETFPELLSSGAHLQGMVDSTYWLDLGTPQAFVRGSADLVLGRAPSPAVPGRCGDRLVLPTARRRPGRQTDRRHGRRRGRGGRRGRPHHGCAVLAGAVVEPGAVITDSLIGAGARIGARTVLAGAVVGDGAEVGADNELRDGVRIWCGATLPRARSASPRTSDGPPAARPRGCRIPVRAGTGTRGHGRAPPAGAPPSTRGRTLRPPCRPGRLPRQPRPAAAGTEARGCDHGRAGPPRPPTTSASSSAPCAAAPPTRRSVSTPDGSVWRASRTPAAPARSGAVPAGAQVEAEAWGPGAHGSWTSLPALLGAEDDPAAFPPATGWSPRPSAAAPGCGCPAPVWCWSR